MLLCFGLFMTSCSNDDDNISPSDISEISTTPGPGYIKIKWDKPDDGTIYYTKIKYFDHLEQKEMWRLSSTDTIQIPNTRAKFGEYEFFLQTYSVTNNANSNIHEVKGVSGVAPATEVVKQITLYEDQLSTNAQEPSEGEIKNLIDGKTDTFFHTQWSGNSPAKPHWMQIALKQELKVFRFQYTPRNNGGNIPTDFDLLGSMDGQTWTIIKNFTKDADKLPVSANTDYKSPTMTADSPFLFLKFSVNETNDGTDFWAMSEFRLYDVNVIDPEAISE